jgi:hypothetical protein
VTIPRDELASLAGALAEVTEAKHAPAATKPPPPWLAALPLVTLAPSTAPRDDRAFVRRQVGVLASLGCPRRQQLEATAIACLEASWGQSPAVAVNNPFGRKPARDIVEHETARGIPLVRYVAAGHQHQGDKAIEDYLGWPSLAEAWRFWLGWHVGAKPGDAPGNPRYADAGDAFWREPDAFIGELCAAGYRGRDGELHPEPRIAAHRSIAARVARLAGP